ncbi:hypothetical protein DITRI_Ditri16bG0017600 [Diplodiscus trichospermus]
MQAKSIPTHQATTIFQSNMACFNIHSADSTIFNCYRQQYSPTLFCSIFQKFTSFILLANYQLFLVSILITSIAMAMLRAFSTRRTRHGSGYERLLEPEVHDNVGHYEAQLKRARSVPAHVFGLSRKFTQELALPEKSKAKTSSSSSNKKVTKSATHPLFSLFDGRRKKKTTAKPEFVRYLEYLREGGMWDMNANMPVIYYK